jgi:hypothetical protein
MPHSAGGLPDGGNHVSGWCTFRWPIGALSEGRLHVPFPKVGRSSATVRSRKSLVLAVQDGPLLHTQRCKPFLISLDTTPPASTPPASSGLSTPPASRPLRPRHLAGLTVRKVVVVPGKLVNIAAG